MILDTKNLTIQTYDDSESHKPELAKIFSYNKLEMDRFQKLGAGIFWSVNPQIDENQRGINNTKELLRIGLDCDVAKEKQGLSVNELEALKLGLLNKLKNLVIPPSGINETKNGLHPYWQFTRAVSIPEGKTEQANEFYKSLIENFSKVTGITSEADNISRVLRLPGYLHLKNPNDPFLVREIYPDGTTCDFEEFKSAYTPIKDNRSDDHDEKFRRLAGQHGWDVYFGITKSEKRSFRGKYYDGRDHLLLAISNSVHNTIKDEEEAYACIEWINLQANEPLSHGEYKKFLDKGRDWINSHPSSQDNISIQPKNIHDWIPQRIEEWKLEKQASKTGYADLDLLIKGFIPKHLYTLTGKTNAGKTTFACNLAHRVAIQGKKVLYLALEPDTGILDILATIATKKEYSELTESDLLRVSENIDVFGSEIKTFDQLKETLKHSSKYDLVIIDHIGYFVDKKVKDSNLINMESELIQSLARLTKESVNSILLIAHLNKEGSRKETPSIYDISGTASFAQDSTEVLIFNREVDGFDKNKQGSGALLIVGKTKSGRNGSVKLEFKNNSGLITSQFEDVSTDKVTQEKMQY